MYTREFPSPYRGDLSSTLRLGGLDFTGPVGAFAGEKGKSCFLWCFVEEKCLPALDFTGAGENLLWKVHKGSIPYSSGI